MINAAQLDWYRRMTPRERTRLMLDLMDMGWEIQRRQGGDLPRRSVEAINRIHRASVEALMAGLDRGPKPDGETSGA